MGRPCIVVAGQGRCGTSLMMQMLSSAGVPCVGDWPGFETDASMIKTFDAAGFGKLAECAIKIIDPANLEIRDMPNHVVIWLDRDFGEQAKSAAKFLSLFMGMRLGRNAIRALASDLKNSRAKHRAAIGLAGGCPSISLTFEDLIILPDGVAARLGAFLEDHGWRINAGAMARCVMPRSPRCFPGFLEEVLLPTRQGA